MLGSPFIEHSEGTGTGRPTPPAVFQTQHKPQMARSIYNRPVIPLGKHCYGHYAALLLRFLSHRRSICVILLCFLRLCVHSPPRQSLILSVSHQLLTCPVFLLHFWRVTGVMRECLGVLSRGTLTILFLTLCPLCPFHLSALSLPLSYPFPSLFSNSKDGNERHPQQWRHQEGLRCICR